MSSAYPRPLGTGASHDMSWPRIEFHGPPYIDAAKFWVAAFTMLDGTTQPAHVKVKVTLEVDDLFAQQVSDRQYDATLRACVISNLGADRIREYVSTGRPLPEELNVSTRLGGNAFVVTPEAAQIMLRRWGCLEQETTQRYVLGVAAEIVDWNGRIDPCRLKEELERRGRPRAPTPEQEPAILALWTGQMEKVQRGYEEAAPGRFDRGAHWRIEDGDLYLDYLSETLPAELERVFVEVLPDWRAQIRSQRLLTQYRFLEVAAHLSRTPAERQADALNDFRQRVLEQFPDWPPPSP